MILVTGGFGFIGSNLVRKLKKLGKQVVVVDNLQNGHKFENLCDCIVDDFFHYEDINLFQKLKHMNLDGVFHLGACSDTTEWNGNLVIEKNYSFSKKVLDLASEINCPLLFASSASVYGDGSYGYREDAKSYKPMNIYGYSKILFENKMFSENVNTKGKCAFRFFNVYGPGEGFKAHMASTIYKFRNQIHAGGHCEIFGAGEGCSAGMHCRDFVYVDDVIDVLVWAFDNGIRGIYNLGSGVSRTFNDVAELTIANVYENTGIRASVKYIDFPDKLKGAYQSYTCADMERLNSAGYQIPMTSLEEGIKQYIGYLEKND